MRLLVGGLLVLLSAVSVATPSVIQAANFTVTNVNDSGAGSLRDAIEQANGAAGPHLITITATGTLNLSSGVLVLSQNMTIAGPGAATLTLDVGTGAAFSIDAGVTASISGIRITGSTESAILAEGNVTLTNVTLDDNEDTDDFRGGALHVLPGGSAMVIGSSISTTARVTEAASSSVTALRGAMPASRCGTPSCTATSPTTASG